MLSSIAASAVPALAVTGVTVLITSNDSDCPWQEKSSKADGQGNAQARTAAQA